MTTVQFLIASAIYAPLSAITIFGLFSLGNYLLEGDWNFW